jgi:hypothetical protein
MRNDIMQVVGLVERFQYAPRESHLKAVKRIFRYLQGTLEFGSWYPKDKNFNLTAYTDVDWEGSIDDRKRPSGGAFFLGKIIVAWSRKKQTSTSLYIRGRIHWCCILLHTSPLDEKNFIRPTNEI